MTLSNVLAIQIIFLPRFPSLLLAEDWERGLFIVKSHKKINLRKKWKQLIYHYLTATSLDVP